MMRATNPLYGTFFTKPNPPALTDQQRRLFTLLLDRVSLEGIQAHVLSNGFYPGSQLGANTTILSLIVQFGPLEVVRYFFDAFSLNYLEKMTCGFDWVLYLAVTANVKPVVEYFITKKQLDPRQTDIFGDSLLHLVATRKNTLALDIAKYLASYISPLQRNAAGKTPIQIARENKYNAMQTLLQEATKLYSSSDAVEKTLSSLGDWRYEASMLKRSRLSISSLISEESEKRKKSDFQEGMEDVDIPSKLKIK